MIYFVYFGWRPSGARFGPFEASWLERNTGDRSMDPSHRLSRRLLLLREAFYGPSKAAQWEEFGVRSSGEETLAVGRTMQIALCYVN